MSEVSWPGRVGGPDFASFAQFYITAQGLDNKKPPDAGESDGRRTPPPLEGAGLEEHQVDSVSAELEMMPNSGLIMSVARVAPFAYAKWRSSIHHLEGVI